MARPEKWYAAYKGDCFITHGPMKPIQLEEGKYSCPSCAMAFTLKTSVKNMFVNNQYCYVCGQLLDWSEEDE